MTRKHVTIAALMLLLLAHVAIGAPSHSSNTASRAPRKSRSEMLERTIALAFDDRKDTENKTHVSASNFATEKVLSPGELNALIGTLPATLGKLHDGWKPALSTLVNGFTNTGFKILLDRVFAEEDASVELRRKIKELSDEVADLHNDVASFQGGVALLIRGSIEQLLTRMTNIGVKLDRAMDARIQLEKNPNDASAQSTYEYERNAAVNQCEGSEYGLSDTLHHLESRLNPKPLHDSFAHEYLLNQDYHFEKVAKVISSIAGALAEAQVYVAMCARLNTDINDYAQWSRIESAKNKINIISDHLIKQSDHARHESLRKVTEIFSNGRNANAAVDWAKRLKFVEITAVVYPKLSGNDNYFLHGLCDFEAPISCLRDYGARWHRENHHGKNLALFARSTHRDLPWNRNAVKSAAEGAFNHRAKPKEFTALESLWYMLLATHQDIGGALVIRRHEITEEISVAGTDHGAYFTLRLNERFEHDCYDWWWGYCLKEDWDQYNSAIVFSK